MPHAFRLALAAALVLSLAACDSSEPMEPPPAPATTGIITGSVTLPAGAPGSVNNARVALYNSFDDWLNDRFVFQTAISGTSYTLENLVPGTYYMDAWKDQNNNAVIDAGDLFGVYGNFSASGTTLTPIPVAAGQTANVSFTITTLGNTLSKSGRKPIRLEVTAE